MAKRLLFLSACLLFTCYSRGRLLAEETTRFFVSSISRDLEIVTQVSTTIPFVGQQFSVIYSLRALRAPSAVDVDPQQYTGFWTDLAPLPEQPRSTIRLQSGRQVSEFLLRQVIAFPLWAGSLELPPLRVKVKNADSKTASSYDWDVIGASNPVSLIVKALPAADGHSSTPPLVGDLEGSLREEYAGTRSELLLEVRGTPNLALLQPEEWIQAPRDIRFLIRLRDSDDTIQTLDTGDTRRLSLLQSRRWSIRVIGRPVKGLRIEGFAIPVFRASQGHWTSVRIQGIEFKGGSTSWSSGDAETTPSREQGGPTRGLSSRLFLAGLIAAASFVLLILIILAYWYRRSSAAKTQKSQR